jgi:hypothetical protein
LGKERHMEWFSHHLVDPIPLLKNIGSCQVRKGD